MDLQESTATMAGVFGQTPNSLKVYLTVKASLGQVLSGSNPVLGCAETVNNIFVKALGSPIGGGYSTAVMYVALQDKCRFMEVIAPLPGDVIISPTGYGNGVMHNGHVGIVCRYGIASNSSEDGKLHENYSLDSWHKIFFGVGGFPVKYFRAL